MDENKTNSIIEYAGGLQDDGMEERKEEDDVEGGNE